ncbi:MAG TPA: hypothetical protein VEK76_06765 [Candidatus Binatia bacterium]|nr:hypothetical protein [Candidatus Binatia bacterium]
MSAGTTGSLSCPSASTISSALGIANLTLTATQTPASIASGASGIGCTYIGAGTGAVEVVLAANVPSSYVDTQEQQINSESKGIGVSFTPISGVGDQAWSYHYSIGSVAAQGVLGVKGSSVAGVYCTEVTTTLSQIESLVNQLFP